MPANKKVAIVCDWILGIGGAERVVHEVSQLYPDAPIYTSQYDESRIDLFKNADVRTTWLQKLPKNNTLKKFLPILRRYAFEGLDLTEFDIVISISGAEAKAVKKLKNGAVHISYIHAPTHYYWSRYDEYMDEPGFGIFNPLARLGLKIFVKPMRKWDKKVAQRPDYLIANSTHIQSEIKKYYGRDSTVIHPPVDVEYYQKYASKFKRTGYVIVGRQVYYKMIHLAVKAFNANGLSLTVIGDGPLHNELVKIGHQNINFVTNITDETKAELLASAQWFVFPGLEDFGIAPVESIAAGTPVIAYKAGGALDYVTSKTGVFFDEQSALSLCDAIRANKKQFDPKAVSAEANKFSTDTFKTKIHQFITSKTV